MLLKLALGWRFPWLLLYEYRTPIYVSGLSNLADSQQMVKIIESTVSLIGFWKHTISFSNGQGLQSVKNKMLNIIIMYCQANLTTR